MSWALSNEYTTLLARKRRADKLPAAVKEKFGAEYRAITDRLLEISMEHRDVPVQLIPCDMDEQLITLAAIIQAGHSILSGNGEPEDYRHVVEWGTELLFWRPVDIDAKEVFGK